MDRSFSRILLALAICLALTATVSADTIKAQFNVVEGSTGVTVAYSSDGGTTYTSISTTTGIFRFTRLANPLPDDFPVDPLAPGTSILAFCIQLGQSIASGNIATFDVVDLPLGRVGDDAPPPPNPGLIGDTRARQIDALFNLAFTDGLINNGVAWGAVGSVSNVIAQAVQLAVWEIAYETLGPNLNINDGIFKATSGATSARTQANTWLNTLNGASYWNNGEFAYVPDLFLFAMTSTEKQDFVIQTGENPDIVVPEPGTMAMVGLALLGLGFVRRRMTN